MIIGFQLTCFRKYSPLQNKDIIRSYLNNQMDRGNNWKCFVRLQSFNLNIIIYIINLNQLFNKFEKCQLRFLYLLI